MNWVELDLIGLNLGTLGYGIHWEECGISLVKMGGIVVNWVKLDLIGLNWAEFGGIGLN